MMRIQPRDWTIAVQFQLESKTDGCINFSCGCFHIRLGVHIFHRFWLLQSFGFFATSFVSHKFTTSKRSLGWVYLMRCRRSARVPKPQLGIYIWRFPARHGATPIAGCCLLHGKSHLQMDDDWGSSISGNYHIGISWNYRGCCMLQQAMFDDKRLGELQ